MNMQLQVVKTNHSNHRIDLNMHPRSRTMQHDRSHASERRHAACNVKRLRMQACNASKQLKQACKLAHKQTGRYPNTAKKTSMPADKQACGIHASRQSSRQGFEQALKQECMHAKTKDSRTLAGLCMKVQLPVKKNEKWDTNRPQKCMHARKHARIQKCKLAQMHTRWQSKQAGTQGKQARR